MPTPQPIYTAANCRFAYQLNWSLSLFWKSTPPKTDFLDDLARATEPAGIRILEHRFAQSNTSQFLVSTKPDIAPPAIARGIKGRLQTLIRGESPNAFRRNFALRGLGPSKRAAVEEYIAHQTKHHPAADPRTQALLERFRINQPDVDLSNPRTTTRALYWYNLHVVLVHAERWREVGEALLRTKQRTILGTAKKHDDRISKASILLDHVHIALSASPGRAPAEVALSYMNNLAYALGRRAVFQFGCYIGTFGEYDRGALKIG